MPRTWRLPGEAIASLALGLVLAGSLGATPVDQEAIVEGDTTAAAADTAQVDTVQGKLDLARESITQLYALVDSIIAVDRRSRGASRDERQVARVMADQMIEQIQEIESDLLGVIPELEAAGAPVDSIKQAFGTFLNRVAGLYEDAIERRSDQIDDLRDRRATIPPDSLAALEVRVSELKAYLDTLLTDQMRTLASADSLEFDTTEHWEVVDRFLKNWAESQVGRLQIALVNRDRFDEQIRELQRSGADPAEIGALRTQRQAADQRIQGIARSLGSTAALLDQRGYPTAQYRQIVIRATGEVTADILDPEVLLGLIREVVADIWGWLKGNGLNLFVKALLVIGIIFLFRILFRLVWWLLRVTGLVKFSQLMMDLVSRLVRPFGTLVGVVAGLSIVGANPAAVLAGLGVAGVIVGLALQDSMSNLAAGMFILGTKPFDVEDIVEAGGVVGTVQRMGLANTTILTFDRRRLHVPNRQIWSNVIENRSAEPIRRVEVVAKISYREDLDRALQVLADLLDVNEMVLDDPEPAIFVKSLADSWIEIAVWPWAKSENWLSLLRGLPRLIRLRFEEEGIEVPYPRRELVALPPEGDGGPPSAKIESGPARSSRPGSAPTGSEPSEAVQAEDLQADSSEGGDDDG